MRNLIRKQQLTKIILIFLGVIILSIFIYFRFMRERLPKDIPFQVTSLGFIIIVAVCLLYCYLVWITIKTKKNSNKAVQISFSFIVKPLEDFDTFIKQISIIKVYYTLFIIWLVYTFEYIFKHLLFDYLFYILPRIVLLTAFIIDTFYFHKLFYIYKVLLIGILLFLRRYILYTVKKLKQDCIHDLQHDILGISTDYVPGVHPSEWPENKTDDDDDSDDIPPTMFLPLELFIDFYAKGKVYQGKEYAICIIFTKHFHNNNINKNIIQLKKEIIYKSLKTILQLAVIVEYSNHNSTNKVIKGIKISIFSLYLLCWSYILVVSYNPMLFETYEILKSFQDNIEPFSGLTITYTNETNK